MNGEDLPAHAEKRHGDKPRAIVGSSSSAAKAAGGAGPKIEGSANDVGGVAAGSTGGPYTIGRTGGAPVHVAGDGLVKSPAPAETRQGGARIQGPHHAQNPPPTKKRNAHAFPPRRREETTMKVFHTHEEQTCDSCKFLDECPEEYRQEQPNWCENWEQGTRGNL